MENECLVRGVTAKMAEKLREKDAEKGMVGFRKLNKKYLMREKCTPGIRRMLALLGKVRQQWRVAGKVNEKECCRREMSRSHNSDLRLRGAGAERNTCIFGSTTLPATHRKTEKETQLAKRGWGRSQILRESLVLIMTYSATKKEKAWGNRIALGKKM